MKSEILSTSYFREGLGVYLSWIENDNHPFNEGYFCRYYLPNSVLRVSSRWVSCLSAQLQQQQSRLMKINHDLRHKISVVEAQGKALIEQKVELEASAQARAQEVGALRQEVARLRERLQGDLPAQNPEEPPPQPPSPAEV